jgi:hypothetical protein
VIEPALSALPGSADQALHPRLEALLQRVQAAERTATGPHRRPTFRLMREILGASVRLGVPGADLAQCLGTSGESLRKRASGPDGTIPAELIQQLTDLTPNQLDTLSNGDLTRDNDPADVTAVYPTTVFIRALLNTPRPDPEKG